MEIILIRHGIAEDEQEGSEDIKRHLTEKGKKKFRKSMPEFKEKLESLEEQSLQLWSSPANRALETAEIVAEELQLEIDSIHDFIYDGEFEKFQSEVQAADKKAKILLVGHEPILSDWAEQITGETFKVKKGEILAFKVSKQSPLQAELEWRIIPA